MALANVSLTNTFLEQMTRINQIIVLINALTDGAQNLTNIISMTALSYANVAGMNVVPTITSAYQKAQSAAQLSFTSVAANGNGVVITASSNSDRLIFANTGNIVVTANAAGGKNLYIDLTTTGVAAGAYGNALFGTTITLDSRGRVVSAVPVLMGDAIDAYNTANAAFAQANSTSGAAAYNTANAAFAQANSASNSASGAYVTANAAFAAANSSPGVASFAQANTARDTANNAYNTANAAFATANSAVASSPANAYNTANAAFIKANSVAQVGWVSLAANGSNTIVTATSNSDTLIFGNTSNIIVLGNNTTKTITHELTATSVGAGIYGSPTIIPVITVDAKGRLTGVTNTAINEVVGIAAFGVANSGLLGYSAANTAFAKANGAVQTGYTLFVANGSQSNISPSSNASTIYFGNTGNITFSTSGASLTADLTTTGVAAGVWGGGANIAAITVDAMGRIVSVSNSAATVALAATGTTTGNANWVNVAANGQILQASIRNAALSMSFVNPSILAVPFIGAMPYGGTIVNCTYFTDVSTATVRIRINGNNVTNLSSLSVTSTAKTNNATGLNTFNTGDKIDASITAFGATANVISLTLLITPS